MTDLTNLGGKTRAELAALAVQLEIDAFCASALREVQHLIRDAENLKASLEDGTASTAGGGQRLIQTAGQLTAHLAAMAALKRIAGGK